MLLFPKRRLGLPNSKPPETTRLAIIQNLVEVDSVANLETTSRQTDLAAVLEKSSQWRTGVTPVFCQYLANFAKKLTPWQFMKSPWIYLAARVEHPMVTTCGHGMPWPASSRSSWKPQSPSLSEGSPGRSPPGSHHPIFGINYIILKH